VNRAPARGPHPRPLFSVMRKASTLRAGRARFWLRPWRAVNLAKGGFPYRRSIEAAKRGGLSELLVGSQEDAALGSILAPLQCRRQVQRVCRSQIIALHKLCCSASEGVGGLDDSPGTGQAFRQPARPACVGKVKLPHAHQPDEGANQLDGSRPPHNNVVAPVQCNNPRRHVLVNSQRNQSARVPKGRNPRYRFSRSARHSCSTTSLETFPGGSGHESDAGRFFSGGTRRPRATSRRSCAVWSCSSTGTILATGLSRSHTSTSSPSRTSRRWALSRAFKSLTFTVLIPLFLANMTILVTSALGSDSPCVARAEKRTPISDSRFQMGVQGLRHCRFQIQHSKSEKQKTATENQDLVLPLKP
jgi:hypothetical protein